LAREEMTHEQADTILSMATPVTTIWDKVLLLPIVGTIDSKRAQSIMETMLEKILQMGAKVIVLDVMGVITIDSAVAQHLLKISQATDLMGCRCIITGISPQIAQAIVQLGLDLGDVTTTATLKDGLEEALTYIHLKVVDSRA
jgi:anti-anti-sigma factor